MVFRFLKLVSFKVCGITLISKYLLATLERVKDTPLIAIEDFSIKYLCNFLFSSSNFREPLIGSKQQRLHIDWLPRFKHSENYDCAVAWNPDKESIEDFLTRMQHNVSNCQWMVHNHTQIAAFVRKVYWD